jgi:chromosome segregation ATPase
MSTSDVYKQVTEDHATQNIKYQQTIKGLKLALDDSKENSKTQNDTITNLTNENSELADKLGQTRKLLTKTENRLKLTEDELKKTKDELKKTKDRVKSTEDELEVTKDSLKSTEDELKDTKNDLRKQRKRSVNLKKR